MSRYPYNRLPSSGKGGAGRGRRDGGSRRYSSRESYGDYLDGRDSRQPSQASTGGAIKLNTATISILAGVLVLGIGLGTLVSTNTGGSTGNIASQNQLDLAVPDPEICKSYGASAFVQDIEIFTTLNPSTSFVTQPALQPGCVIRRENWTVLQQQGAISSQDVRECKQRMNTFAYIGSLRDKPIVKCVYQADFEDNKFLIKGEGDDAVGVTEEAKRF
ncbi:DUF3172 domain-containing protein [Prochlorococcus sp. MIT 1223]|uniref:DUF3172 domain-containing protein n=1 Tax=Prochlorococcus sp. MIT 1223 TaxID=3096217 RepID=UPI002A74D9CE|nr:DUF3172 domain-containing protein [Prochlorococcus sp. MIT 1223]